MRVLEIRIAASGNSKSSDLMSSRDQGSSQFQLANTTSGGTLGRRAQLAIHKASDSTRADEIAHGKSKKQVWRTGNARQPERSRPLAIQGIITKPTISARTPKSVHPTF